jgi:probable rRNA maturation factor
VVALDGLAQEAIAHALLQSKAAIVGPSEVALVLSNDSKQRALNKKWRGKDQTTNVLSFAQLEPFSPLSGLLGDIVLARQTVASEAQNQQKSFEHHFVHLVVHGFLHILGYDHLDDKQADEMESLETAILTGLGVPDPYET